MDKIHEIRVEEVHNRKEGKYFYRIYMEINETIKIILTIVTTSIVTQY